MTEIKLDITHQIRKVINVSRMVLYEHKDAITNKIIYEFTASFANTAQDCYEYREYSSWWQLFKATYFKGWLSRKFPAKFKIVKVDVVLLYPKLKSELPRDLMGPYVTLLTMGQDKIPHFQSFNPDSPVMPYELERQIAEKTPLYNPDLRVCPCCNKPIYF